MKNIFKANAEHYNFSMVNFPTTPTRVSSSSMLVFRHAKHDALLTIFAEKVNLRL